MNGITGVNVLCKRKHTKHRIVTVIIQGDVTAAEDAQRHTRAQPGWDTMSDAVVVIRV